MSMPLSVSALADRYADPDFISRLCRLLRIRLLLEKSIIHPSYRPTEKLHGPIKLTEYGEKYFFALTRKHSVAYPEARLLCFLQMWHIDLLVDPVETDADAILAALSSDVKEIKNIRYPFQYGRLLYDRVADEGARPNKHYLTERDTWELLSGTPQGVAQVGEMLTGPYGVLTSCEPRNLETTNIAQYHCADLSCNDIHTYMLFSSMEAGINKEREKLTKELERECKEESDWEKFLAKSNKGARSIVYDDLNGDPIPAVIGDCLDASEQRSLLAWLLDNTGPMLREQAREVGLSGKADSISRSLGPAEMMQLILLCSNRDITRGIDTLVMKGMIVVPEGETRRPVLNAHSVGPFSLTAEINRYGVRIRSIRENLAPLRLRRLVGEMYPMDSEADRQELDWQLRGEVAERLESKVDQYLRSKAPREAVSTLLLARRSNVIVAAERLQIQLDLMSSDIERTDATLWKLGFQTDDSIDPHGRFWRFHDAFRGASSHARLNPTVADMEKIRESSVNYFVTLEEVLKESLLYTTWALTSDHYSNHPSFFYRPHIDASESIGKLERHASKDSSEYRVHFKERMELYALSRGFDVLADLLQSALSTKEDYRRAVEEMPDWATHQGLQQFPFLHCMFFLDLAAESQSELLGGLKNISKTLVSAEVNEVRNSLLHPRPAELSRLGNALDSIESAVRLIQNLGFSRQVFHRTKVETDEAGRTVTSLASLHGGTAFYHFPSRLGWINFPSTAKGVHVMSSAFIDERPEAARFMTEVDSSFAQLWGTNYPRRPDRSETSRALRIKVSTSGLG